MLPKEPSARTLKNRANAGSARNSRAMRTRILRGDSRGRTYLASGSLVISIAANPIAATKNASRNTVP